MTVNQDGGVTASDGIGFASGRAGIQNGLESLGFGAAGTTITLSNFYDSGFTLTISIPLNSGEFGWFSKTAVRLSGNISIEPDTPKNWMLDQTKNIRSRGDVIECASGDLLRC